MVVSLKLQRLGTPLEPINIIFITLQQIYPIIHTAYDDSYAPFKPPPAHSPVQGSGQGNGASRALWAAISTVLLNNIKFTDIAVFTFVDNPDLIHVNGSLSVTLMEVSAPFNKPWIYIILSRAVHDKPDSNDPYTNLSVIDTNDDYIKLEHRSPT